MNEVVLMVVIVVFIIGMVIMAFVDNKNNKKESLKREQENIKRKKEQEKYEKENRAKERINWNRKIKKNLEIKLEEKPNKKLKVLIADYNSGMISITDSVLESIGVETYLVESGYDILDLINDGEKYDAIITNNIFRNCPDSYVILDQLKEIDGFDIPVIILTVSRNERSHFINDLGFDEYLEKPIDIAKAKSALCSVIKDLKFSKIKK